MGTIRHSSKDKKPGKTDWNAIDALSEEQILERAEADSDAKPLTEADLGQLRPSSPVRVLRMRLGLTQEEFALTYGLSLATVRDWEQRRTEPDQASRTLLRLIDLMPEAVEHALSDEPRSGTDG